MRLKWLVPLAMLGVALIVTGVLALTDVMDTSSDKQAASNGALATTPAPRTQDRAEVPASPKPRVVPPDMVEVPAGSFTMGGDAAGPSEGPAHRVTISKAFFIDRTEVTVAEYRRCVSAGACTAAGLHGADVTAKEFEERKNLCVSLQPGRSDHPINCVDQGQAATYCAFVDKRLPTEAEWEYAARGSDARIHPWGNEPPGCTKAVVAGCEPPLKRRAGTREVGSFPNGASPFGALDMAGNVAEWVWDGWNPDAYQRGDTQDPAASPTGGLGVLRGGAWNSPSSQLKATARLKLDQTSGDGSTGFRCAQGGVDRAPPPTPQGTPLDCDTLCDRDCSRNEHCLQRCFVECGE